MSHRSCNASMKRDGPHTDPLYVLRYLYTYVHTYIPKRSVVSRCSLTFLSIATAIDYCFTIAVCGDRLRTVLVLFLRLVVRCLLLKFRIAAEVTGHLHVVYIQWLWLVSPVQIYVSTELIYIPHTLYVDSSAVYHTRMRLTLTLHIHR
jgi:hypothetical protein